MLKIRRDAEILIIASDETFTVNRIIQIREDLIGMVKDQTIKTLIFDFALTASIDSAGMGVLVASRNTFFKRGGRVILCGIPKLTKKFFNSTGFTEFFNVTNTLDEAVKLAKTWRN